MLIQIQLRIVADDDSVISEDEILSLEKGDDRLEAIGLSLGEAKALLAGIQERVAPPRQRALRPGIGVARSAAGHGAAKGRPRSSSAPSSARSRSPARAFTGVAASRRSPRRSAR